MGEAIAEDYKSSLADLNCNSKLHINVLTILAEENLKFAADIVQTIIKHLEASPSDAKLPSLYLIDSIIKNVGREYLTIFTQHIVSIFASVFQKVDERTRMQMYKLRLTWSTIFPNKILYALDLRTKQVDPAWPINAQHPPAQSIHINPKFLGTPAAATTTLNPTIVQVPPPSVIIQKEENALKAQQQQVLKQLVDKTHQLRLLEEKKRLIAAAKQTILVPKIAPVIQCLQPVADPRLKVLVPPVPRDPRLKRQEVPKVPPLASQPPPQPSVPQASTVLPARTTTLPSVVSVKSKTPTLLEVKPTAREISHKKKEEKLQDVVKDDKNMESLPSDRKSPTKSKSDTQASPKIESPSSLNKEPKGLGKKRKKSDESKSPEDDKKVPITSEAKTVVTPKKSKEKGVEKRKNSPKEKKSFHLQRSPVEEKKHARLRSRSPIHKADKKSHGGRTRKQHAIEAKRKLDMNTRNGSDDVDVDLRCFPNSEEDRGSKGSKHGSEDEKKDAYYEPPEKRLREEKENADVADSLFGREDQDYRQLVNRKKDLHEGWATYKKAHPDEFKIPLRQSRESIDSNQSTYEDFGNNNEKVALKSPGDIGSSSPMEYDRLGRPRLHRMRQFQRSESLRDYPKRDGDFRFDPNMSDQRLHDILKMGDPKEILRRAEERYRLGTMTKADFDDIQRDLENMSNSQEFVRFKDYRPMRRDMLYPIRIKSEFKKSPQRICSEFEYNHLPPGQDVQVQGPKMPVPAVRTFKLDNKLRTIHFVDGKAIILLDNDEPRQLMFRGEPTQVFIEGMKPFLLRFDGQPVEFELDGKIYSMKFGAPSRELYINNYPYEGKFGGPFFSAMLENGRIYKVSLGGPPPTVQLSEQPAYDLYQKFLSLNTGDVDMRLQPNVKTPKDTDWRPMGLKNNTQEDQRRDNRPPPIFKNSEQRPFDLQSGFEEDAFDDRLEDTYPNEHKEWNPEYRPQPPDSSDSTTRQSEWRHPSYQGVQMADSPRNTPPRDGPTLYPGNRDPPPPPMQFNPEQRLEPSSRPWLQRNFGSGGSRFPRPPGPEPRFNQSRDNNNSQHYEDQRYPEYYAEPSGPHKFRHPLRPPFNSRPQRPEFNDESSIRPMLLPPLPRHHMQPWRHPRHPALLPPPRPPMLLKMSNNAMRADVPVTSANTNLSSMLQPSFPPVSLSTSLPANPLLPTPTTSQPSLPASSAADVPITVKTEPPDSSTLIGASPQTIDINSLFAKLLAAGVISKPNADEPETAVKAEVDVKEDNGEVKKEEEEKEPIEEVIPPIELKVKSLRKKQSGVISALYRGSQCASCGMRFKEVHGDRYSRHLDWHFRMNRREKDGVKKAFSRKWYYEVEDWIQFEEFEDFEERARSFFELQADQEFQVEPAVEVPSVPVSGQETEACVVCEEPFQLFWVEEEEEWHLRNAVRHDEQAYHPSCYEDFIKASRVPDTPVEEKPCPDNDILKEEDIKKEPVEEAEPVKEEEPVTESADPEVIEEFDDSEIVELVEMLTQATVLEEEKASIEELEAKEEAQEEKLEGKPGVEEVIGLISESDMEAEIEPQEESERVVFESGGIIMKVRAESLKPASPMTDNVAEKGGTPKEPIEESEEEFRPPTPDPRFNVLPPVQRGTELSGLCSIM